MKQKELSEMTQSFGKVGSQLSNALKFADVNKGDYSHVGDMNEADVLFKNEVYLIVLNTKSIAFFQVVKRGNTALVQNMYVVPEHRKEGWMSMFLYFLKQNEGYARIQLGDRHSEDTIEAVKRISKRFKVYWEKDGKRYPYTVDTIDKFYSLDAPSGWNIILENDGIFIDYPKFRDDKCVIPDIRLMYDILLD